MPISQHSMTLDDSLYSTYDDNLSPTFNFFSFGPQLSTDQLGYPCTTNHSPHNPISHSTTIGHMSDNAPEPPEKACAPTSEPPLGFSWDGPPVHSFWPNSHGGILDSPFVSTPVELPPSPPITVPFGTHTLPSEGEESETEDSAMQDVAHPSPTLATDSLPDDGPESSDLPSCSAFLPALHSEWDDEPEFERGAFLFPGPGAEGEEEEYQHMPESTSPSSSTDSEPELLETPQSSTLDLPSFDDSPYGSEYDRMSDFGLLSSPCRSFSELPELDDMPPMLASPTQCILGLPGADVDDGLLPLDMDFSSNIDRDEPEKPLLFTNEPTPFRSPRSFGQGNSDNDLIPEVVAKCTDPYLHSLIEARRRARERVHVARQFEEEAIQLGDCGARMSARRMRKREKDRVKEITAMLRLQLYPPQDRQQDEVQDLERSPREPPSPVMLGKEAIRTPDHLVAKMMLRRKDRCRPMSARNNEAWEDGGCGFVLPFVGLRKSPLSVSNSSSMD